MDLLRRFQDYIRSFSLTGQKDHLLIAVSGGIDSVVLCELIFQSGYKFSIAHCNFQLRGNESERDQEFVQSVSKKYSVPFLVKKFDTENYAKEKKVSIQVAARELRYAWFHELIQQGKGHCIVTAHHLDDNIETVLMNFFKGTGLAGLRGMLPQSGKIIRPLLFARKEELLEFAKQEHLQWVEDSSNASNKYSRNYLRHELIPIIEKIFPSAIDNLGDNIGRFRELEKFQADAVELQLKKLVEKKGEELHIPILKLKKMTSPKTILHALITPFGFGPAAVEETVHLMESETGKYLLSDTHRILKNRNWLIISPLEVQAQQQVVVDDWEEKISFKDGQLLLKRKPADSIEVVNNNGKALLDEEKIKFPLILRKWKPGDYFYPLGMKKKKKLARFFIDQKLSLSDKEKTWVIEMNRKIVWVVGMRIDDRFKITASTKNVMEISLDQNRSMK